MHLVGFIIRIYHDARSPERQIRLSLLSRGTQDKAVSTDKLSTSLALILHRALYVAQKYNSCCPNVVSDFTAVRTLFSCTRFVQKVSGLTTVHEVDKAYRVLTLTVFNIVPFRSYTLRRTFLLMLETFCELLFRDV